MKIIDNRNEPKKTVLAGDTKINEVYSNGKYDILLRVNIDSIKDTDYYKNYIFFIELKTGFSIKYHQDDNGFIHMPDVTLTLK